jgi:molybdenum cofactor guanylyltransferase
VVAAVTTTPVDAIVLAGGRSTRMGIDKATLDRGGHRQVDHIVAVLAQLGGTVVVASGARPLGCRDEVADPAERTGPLAGILAGLTRVTTAFVAIAAVDLAAPSVPVLQRLAALVAATGRAAAMPSVDGRLQPLHAVMARQATAALVDRAAHGERSPRRALGALDALVVGPDGWCDLDPAGAFAEDWDTPEDLPPGVG